MIIRFPTGLYKTQIPQSPSDEGNVTYTISTEDPASSAENFIIFPIAEQLKTRSSRVYTDEQRRARLGDLVYSISSGGSTVEGRNTKLFEVGQILEFTDESTTSGLDSVQKTLEIQHNTNLLDLEGLGLTEDEMEQLGKNSSALQKQLERQLSELKNQITDNNAAIKDLQKTINEANKALSALAVLGGNEDLVAKVTTTRDEAQIDQNLLIDETTLLNTLASQTRDKLYAISELVR
jgi:hypothetical protein